MRRDIIYIGGIGVLIFLYLRSEKKKKDIINACKDFIELNCYQDKTITFSETYK